MTHKQMEDIQGGRTMNFVTADTATQDSVDNAVDDAFRTVLSEGKETLMELVKEAHPKKRSEVYALYFNDGLRNFEIAKILGVSQGAVSMARRRYNETTTPNNAI